MQSPTEIYLLRHGQIDGAPALNGQTDVPLSKLGWQNMSVQCERLPKVDHIVTSPLQRCAQFAHKLAAERNLEVQVTHDIQECDFGDWDGIPYDILGDTWRDMESFFYGPASNVPPNGESLDHFHRRITTYWQKIRSDTQRKGHSSLIICHGGVIRTLLAHILQTDWRNGAWYSQLNIGYGSLSKITIPTHPEAQATVNFIGLPPTFGSVNDE